VGKWRSSRLRQCCLGGKATDAVVPQPALSSFPSSLAPGSPPEFFTVVRYSALVMTLPSCSAQNIASWNPRLGLSPSSPTS
jgi:hypothetical protein